MNKLLVNAMNSAWIRAVGAWVFTDVPGARRLLVLAKPPAAEAFIAFVDTLAHAGHDAPTACAGWTVHELTAHVTAGSAEIADLIELELGGQPVRATRDFEEREAPYRALSPRRLRRAFFREALRATAAVESLSSARRQVTFTGVQLDASALVAHISSELVLHRWDITGCDDSGRAALSDPGLGDHAIRIVARMQPDVLPRRGGVGASVILRSPGALDLAVTSGDVAPIANDQKTEGCSVVTCDPAVRTLLVWGRRPDPVLPYPEGDRDTVDALLAMLIPGAVEFDRRGR